VTRLFVLPLLAALAIGCKHDAAPSPHPASESPIAAPASLIAEGTLRDPDALWGRIRKGSSGALAQMPDTAAGAILSWAGVDRSLGPLVSGGVPFHMAIGDAPDGVAFAIAMKLGDLGAVRSALVEGETARYRGDDVDGMIRLVPREGASSGPALAVTWSGYLVIASSAADVGTLGAYAVRTLPTKPLPASSFELRIDPAALVRAGKSAPDFATKATALLANIGRSLLPPEVDAGAFAACFTPGLRDTTTTAGDLVEARIDADADEARLEAIATLVPKPGDNGARRHLAAIHPADATPLLDAPREALAALFWSDTAETRLDDTSTVGPCVGKALAPILGPNGGPKLADLLSAWARGRGDWETASFVAKPSVAGLVLRAPVSDAGGVSRSLRGFADLASQPSVSDAVRRLLPLRAGEIQSAEVPRVGKASVLTFPSRPPASRGEADPSTATPDLSPPGLAWAVDAKEVDVGLGQAPKELLALARATTTFRTIPSVEHAVGSLGADASFAALLVPPGCCTGAGPESAPLMLGWGRRAESGQARLSIGDELLGQVIARALSR
jgi:hypothetical protein